MIKSIPNIYPGETVFSFFSRMYCHSGYIFHTGIANEILARPTAYCDFNFINLLKNNFKKQLDDYIGFDNLIFDHTLFKYYGRFLPLEKRNDAYLCAKNNKLQLYQKLSIPIWKRNYKLRYCPKCVIEDRQKYGECYFHIEHNFPEIHICPIHNCELKDTSTINCLSKENRYKCLEEFEIDLNESRNSFSKLDLKIIHYVYDVFKNPINISEESRICDYLDSRCDSKYLSARGERKHIDHMFKDIKAFYKNSQFGLSKNDIKSIFRGLNFNAFKICLLAYFEGITPDELCKFHNSSIPRYVLFDNKVKELSKQGKNYLEIASMMNCNKEVIRKIILGAYEKEKRYKRGVNYSKKWDWGRIDLELCNQFDEIDWKSIEELYKRNIASRFGLKDKSLRNLPRLKAKIRNKKSSFR